MRIGIDGMLLTGKYSGVENYILNLCAALPAGDENLDVTVFVPLGFRRKEVVKGPRLHIRRALIGGHVRTLRIFWEQFWFPFKVVSHGFDLIHFPAYIHPMVRGIPTVLTIHDLIAVTAPGLCASSNVHYYSRFLKRSIERATRIITPTERVREEVWRLFHKPRAAIDVIPMATDPSRWQADTPSARSKYGLGGEPYVLYVGNIEPKKGITFLVKAFFAAAMHKRLPHRLVIVGRKAWKSKPILRLIREFGPEFVNRITVTGYVPDADLPALYREAELFVFPSILEGFGMPPLEAMAAGVPVLLAGEPSLREVYADHAHFFTIADIKDLREKLELLLENSEERGKYVGAAREYARTCTWEQCARATAETYRRARRDFEQNS